MKFFIKAITTCVVSLIILSSFAQVKLPQLVGDSMVLQRDMKINIWGWASTGEKVRVKFNGKIYKTTTGE